MTEPTSIRAVPVSHVQVHRFMTAINAVTLVGGIVLIFMSPWPGYANGWLAVLSLPWIAAIGLVWLVVASRALPPPLGESATIPIRSLLVTPVLVCTTLVALLFYVPRRIAFAACRTPFEQMLPSAPAPDDEMSTTLNRRLGIYHVDEWASDVRGGVYFRTGKGSAGIGPDVMSYGFAYRPNREGTPFGAAGCIVRPLGGDWYWFCVSDDWY